MAFSDPQSVTINAVAVSLPRTGSGTNSGTFQSADGAVILGVSHAVTKSGRVRHQFRLDHSKIASDPLTAENTEFSMSVTLSADLPRRGYTTTEAKQIVDALVAYLSASSGANVTKLLGNES